MKKIQKLSRIMRIVFQLFALIIIGGICVQWIFFDELKSGSFFQNLEFCKLNNWYSLPKAGGLTVYQQLGGFVLHALPVSFLLLCMYNLIQLFRSFEVGNVFGLNSIARIRKMGKFLILYVIAGFLIELPMSLLLTFRNPVGERSVNIGIYSDQIFALALAGIIFLVGHILVEAHKLKHEQDYTV